jgi:ribosomal protein L7Ae-like RNA K-turn-binding protein
VTDDGAVTWRKVLALVGLGVRARKVVIGVEQVRLAAARGRLALAVVAPDASKHSRDKVLPLLTGRRIDCIEGPSALELGAAVGRQTTAAVGVVDADLANGIRNAARAALKS